MIFDIGWIELLVIAAVAIVVVGPKDLPRLMRIVGQWVGKARGLAREFQRSFDDMVRESELEDLKKQVEELRKMNPIDEVKRTLDPNQDMHELDQSIRGEIEAAEAAAKAATGTPAEVDLEEAQTKSDEERETFRKESIVTDSEGAPKP